MHLELFGVTKTPKNGQLKEVKKSLGSFEDRPSLQDALNDHKAAGHDHLIEVDHERKEALEHILERKNFRIRARKYDFKAPKKTAKKAEETK